MISYTATNGLIRTPRGDFKSSELEVQKYGGSFWIVGKEPKFGGNFFTGSQYHISFIERFDSEQDARDRLAEMVKEARRH